MRPFYFRIWIWAAGSIVLGTLLAGCQPARLEVSNVQASTITPTRSHPATQSANEILYPTRHLITGDLTHQIADLIELMPGSGSEGFLEPQSGERIAFSQLIGDIQRGNIEQAINRATDLNYELIEFTDRGDEHARSYLLREEQPIQKGWGLYVIRIGSASNIIVEAPHPGFDRNTPSIALDIFRSQNARALLIAGAHRLANENLSADIAHNPQTIFQAAHETLTASEEYVILQIHGFASSKHPGYPQVIVGSDYSVASAVVDELALALETEDISVGVCDGNSWSALCGTTNVQLASTISDIFIHLEINEEVRNNPQALIPAVKAALLR